MSDLDYKIIKQLEIKPNTSQRELSKHFGISLGKVNFILRALINKGLIKATDFKNSNNKRSYIYQLTSKGISRKAKMAVEFLHIKKKEYEKLQIEIEEIKKDIEND